MKHSHFNKQNPKAYSTSYSVQWNKESEQYQKFLKLKNLCEKYDVSLNWFLKDAIEKLPEITWKDHRVKLVHHKYYGKRLRDVISDKAFIEKHQNLNIAYKEALEYINTYNIFA